MTGVQELRSELRSYWLNHSFLLGHQWTYWDMDQRRLDTVTSEGERIQATVNRTRSNMRTLMGNLTQRDLQFENRPKAYDDASIKAARIGETAAYDTAKAHAWEELREDFLYALFKGGTAGVSVDWDANNKETIETVLTVGDFIVEPGAISARKARWWVRRQSLPTDEVWSMFKEHFGEKRPAVDSISSLDPYMHRIVGDSFGHGAEIVDRTHVYTYYERPNPLSPEGKILVEVAGEIVERIDAWPFPFKDRLNLVTGVETQVEGRWYGATFMDDVRPLQVALNAAWSNLLEHLRDAGATKMTVPSSGVDLINSLDDVPGGIVEYPDGADKPSYMNPAQLSAWLQNLPDMLSMAIDDAMSVHEVSRGQAPGQIESGLGVQILTENDNSPSGKGIRTVARVFSEVATLVLEILSQEVKEQRETLVLDGVTPNHYKWTGADLKGNINITVPLEQIVPVNRAALQAEAQKLLEMGLVETLEDYIQITQAPNASDIIAVTNPALAKARRENAAFVMGEVPLPAEFDVHEVHIPAHNAFRMTEAYELLSEDEQEVVDLHIMAHETMAAAEAGTAMMDMEVGGPALAAAPNADGSQIDPALLQEPGLGAPMPLPEQGIPMPPPQEVPDPLADASGAIDELNNL
jgi:hypothetical protein